MCGFREYSRKNSEILRLLILSWMSRQKSCPIKNWTALVEMAGIEPASERCGAQTSTSVVGCVCRRVVHNRQGGPRGHPLCLKYASRLCVQHSGIVSPVPTQPEGGRGGRGSQGAGQLLASRSYAASGKAAYSVLLALEFCAGFTRSAPLCSQFGSSLNRRSQSSPRQTL